MIKGWSLILAGSIIACQFGKTEDEESEDEEEGQEYQEGNHLGDCYDGEDNDEDGLIDCEDDGCFDKPVCIEDDTAIDDTGESWGCPDEVPDEFQYIWDCENTEGCLTKLYRYGVGESFSDGSILVTEQWFSFEGNGAYCVDTFQITGSWSSQDPVSYGGVSAEEIFLIEWEMIDSQCDVIWSPLFADQEADNPVTQSYGGFIMFDTHDGWGIRHADYEALVIASPVNGNQYAPNTDYAQGSVIPTGSHSEPGESDNDAGEFQKAEYAWGSSGDCLQ